MRSSRTVYNESVGTKREGSWRTLSRFGGIVRGAAKPFPRDFQLQHGIGPSSSIKASLDSLTKKGILVQESGGGYLFTDIFFPR